MIYNGGVVKLVNTLDLKSSGCNGFGGSIPLSPTNPSVAVMLPQQLPQQQHPSLLNKK